MKDEANESYRKVAVLLAKMARERELRSVVFSSPDRGEGTTTAVLNVAHHLKKSYDLNPLVVEFNLERPVFISMFDLDPSKTVQALATGALPLDECIQTCSLDISLLAAERRDAATGLVPDMITLLRRVLDEASKRFDMIIVDAPPVLKHADAIAASSVVGGVFLVVEAGHTRQEMLDRVRLELEWVGVKVLGAVLNKHKRFIPKWVYRSLVQ